MRQSEALPARMQKRWAEAGKKSRGGRTVYSYGRGNASNEGVRVKLLHVGQLSVFAIFCSQSQGKEAQNVDDGNEGMREPESKQAKTGKNVNARAVFKEQGRREKRRASARISVHRSLSVLGSGIEDQGLLVLVGAVST